MAEDLTPENVPQVAMMCSATCLKHTCLIMLMACQSTRHGASTRLAKPFAKSIGLTIGASLVRRQRSFTLKSGPETLRGSTNGSTMEAQMEVLQMEHYGSTNGSG